MIDMTKHPQRAKSLSDEQIAEIKRVVNAGETSRDFVCWAYGITDEQLNQVMEV